MADDAETENSPDREGSDDSSEPSDRSRDGGEDDRPARDDSRESRDRDAAAGEPDGDENREADDDPDPGTEEPRSADGADGDPDPETGGGQKSDSPEDDDRPTAEPDAAADLDGGDGPPDAGGDGPPDAGGDGPPDEDGSFGPSDLVAGGEYVGNTGDDSDGDEDDQDRPGTATASGEDPDDASTPDGFEGPPGETVDAPREPLDDRSLAPDEDRPEPIAPEVDPADAERPDGERPVAPPDPDGNFSEGERPDPEAFERPDNMAEATPIQRKTGPAEDQEMPLADHVEEMVSRLFIIVAIAGLVSVAMFPFGEEIIDVLWYQVLPGGDVSQPRVYHPLALVITQLKVASLGGLIIALPVFVYQTYAFMRPGLYPNERRYYLAAVPTSLVLAFVGVTFAFYVLLPAIFTYFLYYSDTVVTIAFALTDTFNLILLMMGYLAVVFQIPLFIMLAIMMGLVTRRWLENRRLYFWAAFLGISFIFNPDPTGMAPFLMTITMITLFEGTLLLLRWTRR